MTESDWLTSTDPQAMLAFLRDSGKASDRKLQLFVVACCRRILHLLADERSRRAVEVAELLADGLVDNETRSVTRRTARYAMSLARRALQRGRKSGDRSPNKFTRFAAALVAVHVLDVRLLESRIAFWVRRVVGTAADGIRTTSDPGEAERAERAAQAHLLRDIFGPLPFRPVTLPPSARTWNSACVVKMAAAMYEERDFSQERMGVLADALEEAGVTDEEMLGHCRDLAAVHVRGCWLVDLLTGRE
jgi:hypothetical protein